MNYGYQNEIDFVNHFNNKYFFELDKNSQLFLQDLFEVNISNHDMIQSWKNKATQKADIFIKYKKYVKGVSIKCGKSNSIHCESIQSFKMFLGKMNIPYQIIEKYISYHYGYMRDDAGNINYSKILSAKEYLQLYQSEIDVFNKYINKTKIIINMVDRFLVRGTNSDYDIDALVCGTIDDYVWITKHDLYDLILSKRNRSFPSPHIACITIGPKKRNLFGNSKNKKDRYLVAIRWNHIKEDIINFYHNRPL